MLFTESGPSKYAVSSPKPFVGITNDSCSSVEGSQSDSEKDKVYSYCIRVIAFSHLLFDYLLLVVKVS